ncbi:uncharacterized protein IL334_005804 [Kwoniella shivajii]|uniref:Methyltransferase domain-containing protein n=1 Tax=Kwoniella shivajii TaxID=564305 RepID=A0ABZ1D687_9TREE|nr:hypothetical protein IL334_005804 [Kwoniella shivajii]
MSPEIDRTSFSPKSGRSLEFEEHDGRLYNGVQENYQLPADKEEIIRLNSQHRALTMLFGSLIPSAIVENIEKQTKPRILDVGCGTGIWSIEVALKYPQAFVTGVDLVSIHPSNHSSNVEFVKLDILDSFPEGWEGSFDLIHARYLIAGIRDFALLVSSLTKLLSPNGHLLIIEPQALYRTASQEIEEACPATAKYVALVNQAMAKLQIDPNPGKTISEYLQSDGRYDQVVTRSFDMPLSPWSKDLTLKEVGQAHLPVSLSLPGAFRRIVLSTEVTTADIYDRLTVESREEIDSGKGELSLPVWMTFASKL